MSPSKKSKKILVVEDNAPMSNLLRDIFEVFDYQTLQACDGEEALELLKEEPFEMVITDIRMPKLNGVELLKIIKENYPQVPVVVITGFKTGNETGKLVLESADGFLYKPFKVEDIEKLLRQLVQKG